jgi:VWFA-related protein
VRSRDRPRGAAAWPLRFTLLAALAATLTASFTPAAAQDAQRRRGFSISITEPENQAVVFGKTKIAAQVEIADPADVDRVEFIVGDEVVFVDREPPYECFHDFGEESRSWIVRAVAYHVEEISVSDAVITRRLRFATVEQVNRVILWITAKDKDGNFLTDLGKDEFRVYEDGEEQRVLDFYHETRPITMAILIDTSGSMHGEKIRAVHGAAGAFVESLRPIDSALVIDFDENVFLIQELTSDHEDLKEAIGSTEAIGATALYDALHAAYRKIGSIDGRKVIVLLSDGDDTSSQFGFKRVLEEAKSNNTMVFTIGLSGEGGGAKRNVLADFSDNTGGRVFMVKKPEELAEAYGKIAEELGKQFYLSYSTTNEEWDGHWVKLKVESTRPGVKVRARKGYFAVRGRSVESTAVGVAAGD